MPIPYRNKLKETAKQIAVLGRPKPSDGVNRVESRDHDAQPLDSRASSASSDKLDQQIDSWLDLPATAEKLEALVVDEQAQADAATQSSILDGDFWKTNIDL